METQPKSDRHVFISPYPRYEPARPHQISDGDTSSGHRRSRGPPRRGVLATAIFSSFCPETAIFVFVFLLFRKREDPLQKTRRKDGGRSTKHFFFSKTLLLPVIELALKFCLLHRLCHAVTSKTQPANLRTEREIRHSESDAASLAPQLRRRC